MTCEPALYGHDKDSSDTAVSQTDRGSGDKEPALRLIHLFGSGGAEVRRTTVAADSHHTSRLHAFVKCSLAGGPTIFDIWTSEKVFG